MSVAGLLIQLAREQRTGPGGEAGLVGGGRSRGKDGGGGGGGGGEGGGGDVTPGVDGDRGIAEDDDSDATLCKIWDLSVSVPNSQLLLELGALDLLESIVAKARFA
jgi:hypothetical protein